MIAALVDIFSRFSPTVYPRFSYRGEDVVLTLERICGGMGYGLRQGHHRLRLRRPQPADAILDEGGEHVILPPRRRKYQHSYDKIAYCQRWGIESFFANLKQWRRIATRYDKLAANFIGFIKIASVMLWLKRLNRHHRLELQI
jgi:transposase